MNDYTYKEHNIYDDGFDELLHRGKEMVSSFLKRPPARQKRKKDQVRHLKAEFKDNILYFDDKKFDFNNDAQNQKDLLITIFKNKIKNWSYDEIQEDWDETGVDKETYPDNFWKKFYTAANQISNKIAVKTLIEDFFIKNTKEIRINPKYV
jgi:hypothetical protein